MNLENESRGADALAGEHKTHCNMHTIRTHTPMMQARKELYIY
jgi:hypothetical protein